MVSDNQDSDINHIITISRVLKEKGNVADPDRLLGEKKQVNMHGWERKVGVALEIDEVLRRSYECSCGERFLKAHTAAEHLRKNRESDTTSNQS